MRDRDALCVARMPVRYSAHWRRMVSVLQLPAAGNVTVPGAEVRGGECRCHGANRIVQQRAPIIIDHGDLPAREPVLFIKAAAVIRVVPPPPDQDRRPIGAGSLAGVMSAFQGARTCSG